MRIEISAAPRHEDLDEHGANCRRVRGLGEDRDEQRLLFVQPIFDARPAALRTGGLPHGTANPKCLNLLDVPLNQFSDNAPYGAARSEPLNLLDVPLNQFSDNARPIKPKPLGKFKIAGAR